MSNFNNSYRGQASAIALTISLLAIAPAAFAQTSVDTEANDAVDEIIITARKREETLLEAPLAVTALSQAQLDERGILSSAELSKFVPGFDYENQGTGGNTGRSNPQVRFRGVGLQINTPGAGAGAFFWDGGFISDGVGILPLFDLEQTEVVKGPQAAVFGRNTFSGAVNFRPATPTDEFMARGIAGIKATDDNTGYELRGIVSGPINDRVRARLALSHENNPADYEFQDGSPLGEEETNAIQGSVHFDFSDNTTLKYSGYLVDSEDTWATGSILSTIAPADCDLEFSGSLRRVGDGSPAGDFTTDLSEDVAFGNLFCGSIPEFDDNGPDSNFLAPTARVDPSATNFDFVNLQPAGFPGLVRSPQGLGNTYQTWRNHISLASEFDNGYSFDGFASWGSTDVRTFFDSSNGRGALSYSGFARRVSDTNFEARINSPDEGRYRYMVGANWFESDVDTFLTTTNIEFSNSENTSSQNLGLFATFDYDITDAFTVSLEGRWSDDKQTVNYNGPSSLVTTGIDTTFAAQEQSFSEFIPRVILSYSPEGSGINVYGSYSKSYLQGVSTNATVYGAQVPDSGINPETVGFFTPTQELDSFELGFKHEVGDWLQYSLAGYAMDWKNQAFVELALPFFTNVNLAGDSEYVGVEGEFTAELTDWFTLSGNANYVDAEFTDFGGAGTVAIFVLAVGEIQGFGPGGQSGVQIDAAGNQPRYIPGLTGAISADFDLDSLTGIPAFFRTDAIYTGDFFIDNFEYNEVGSAWKVNLRAGVDISDSLSVEAYMNNAFDDRTPSTSGGTTFGRSFFSQPVNGRIIGARLIADF